MSSDVSVMDEFPVCLAGNLTILEFLETSLMVSLAICLLITVFGELTFFKRAIITVL